MCKHLADIGLTSFAMVTGGKGVHVVVPLTPGHSWDAHKSFAERFARALAQELRGAPPTGAATLAPRTHALHFLWFDWVYMAASPPCARSTDST